MTNMTRRAPAPAIRFSTIAGGVLALGAAAVGAALMRITIPRVSIGRAKFDTVEVDTLTVRKLNVIGAAKPRRARAKAPPEPRIISGATRH